jgi:ribonuclease HI
VSHTKIYTDGAFSPKSRRGGWAFVVVENDKVIFEKHGRLTGTTNNRCELQAIIRAIEYSIGEKLPYFEIVTDSQYCQQGMVEWAAMWARNDWKTSSGKPVANSDLWQHIESLLEQVERFKVSWIRGHSGNSYNDRADFLASKGRVA